MTLLFTAAGGRRVVHREDAGPIKNAARAAGDDPFDGFASFRILRQGVVLHALLKLKTTRFLSLFLRDRFVDVGGHNRIGLSVATVCSKAVIP
jgi:hypothetical protein